MVAAAARLAVEAQTAPKSAGADADSAIEARVRDFLRRGAIVAVIDIGARAKPALIQIVRESPGDYPERIETDALHVLGGIDEAAAAALVPELARQGFLARKRCLRMIQEGRVLTDAGTWVRGQDDSQPPLLAELGWVAALEALAEHADVRSETCAALKPLAVQDALSPKLQQLLIDCLKSPDGTHRQAALATLDDLAPRATVTAVFKAVITGADTAVRREAALHLLNEINSPELLARAQDEDVGVRSMVVRSLSGRQVSRAKYNESANPSKSASMIVPNLGAAERATLLTLAKDASSQVRGEACLSILELDAPFADEVYAAMAEDRDPKVRRWLLQEIDHDHPALATLLNAWASDRTPEVREQYRVALCDAASKLSMAETARFGPLVPGYLAFLRDVDAQYLREHPAVLGSPLYHLLRLPAVAGRGLAEILDRLTPEVASQVVMYLPFSSGPKPAVQPQPTVSPSPALRELDPLLVARLLRTALVPGSEANYPTNVFRFARHDVRAGLDLSVTWHSLVSDPKTPRFLRVWAASVACVRPDDTSTNDLQALLRDPSWKTEAPTNTELDGLRELGREFDRARVEAALLPWIGDRSIHDAALLPVLAQSWSVHLPASWARPIVERWVDAGGNESDSLVGGALMRLPIAEDAATVELVRRALHQPGLANAAVRCAGRMRLPAYLDLLSEALAGGLRPTDHERAQLQEAAARSLTAYMNEAAAERLLAGVAQALSTDAREACLAGLAQIRQYLDERQRWLVRDTQLEQRAVAIQQVVLLLADPDTATRAQAARSLATLDALEHIPKLLALLKDKSPEVRAAAQQALDQLNAKSAKKD